MPMSTYGFRPCSAGSSMLSPTERAPASRAPRFAASIVPGPPPVITAMPASPIARPTSRACSYSSSPGAVRAEPKTQTAVPTWESV